MTNSMFLYIGPGMGVATLVVVFIIAGIVLFALGYILWYKFKGFFKKKD